MPPFQVLIIRTQQILEQLFKEKGLKKPLIIVGLSGGPDSVFLLHLLHQLTQHGIIRLAAAHLDHGWRENSANDVSWCKQLCDKLNISFYSEHAQNIAAPKNLGSQEALGRSLRRTFFKNLAQNLGADLIALGHHADDQQETFFLRLIRGSSLGGLGCMNTFSEIYFRPLLNVKKSFILEYLNKQKFEYLIDYTNTSDLYLRNRIRNSVIPALRSCDQRFDEKFTATLERLREEDDFLQTLAQKAFEKLFTFDQKTTRFIGDLAQFKALHPALQKRMLMLLLVKNKAPFTPQHSFLLEILKFLNGPQGGSHQLHETWLMKKEGHQFWLSLKIS